MVRFNADTVSWYSETVHLGDGGGGVREGKRGGREKDGWWGRKEGKGALIEGL